ncbi:aminoacyl tRNA synthase complex-interacting multifunctional protein 1-like [Rhopilema esculentum]|uniref:aminoacyl tRNA synthase complex-interacting multifunctional protein 1-like n=1 Tax=Rhopilema esculentum TaxID=499914 RepID=UPI0031D0522B|eukprot:gene10866-19686_t
MVLDKLVSNAAAAEQTVKILSQRLAGLQKAYEEQKRQREELEKCKIVKENESLKQQIEGLKFDVDCLRVQNGARSIRLPKSKPVSLAPVDLPKEEDKSNTRAATETQPIQANEKKVNNKKKAKESSEEKSKPNNAGKSDESRPVDASRLDLRVGKIIHVERHPDADTLYVEKVDLGEENPRTIVSGLVKHVPIEEMQNRLAIFMCNLKPAKMRGILSQGMIMCASTPEKVQPLLLPEGATIGDKVRMQGYTVEPDVQLNPKRKIWEQVKPDMLVNSKGIASYKGKEFYIEGKGSCYSSVLKNCPIS